MQLSHPTSWWTYKHISLKNHACGTSYFSFGWTVGSSRKPFFCPGHLFFSKKFLRVPSNNDKRGHFFQNPKVKQTEPEVFWQCPEGEICHYQASANSPNEFRTQKHATALVQHNILQKVSLYSQRQTNCKLICALNDDKMNSTDLTDCGMVTEDVSLIELLSKSL